MYNIEYFESNYFATMIRTEADLHTNTIHKAPLA